MRTTIIWLTFLVVNLAKSQATLHISSPVAPVGYSSAIEADWLSARGKAEDALGELSNEEKAGIVIGRGFLRGPCVGNTHDASKIGFPALCLQDGSFGVTLTRGVTAFPPGIQAAATWDRKLIHQRGVAIGEEARELGIHVMLGPVGGPLGKIPHGGRNWEGFGVDPYLAGVFMAETIKGMQSVGVQACAKGTDGVPYAACDWERARVDRKTINVDIDDRTLHELYLWPFADAVQADVASMMCAYNKFKGKHACESDELLNGIVKQGLDFKGYIVSDWSAQQTTLESATGGLDMAMPGDSYDKPFNYLWKDNLSKAVSRGTVPQSRLDDMVRRVLTSWYFMKQDSEYPEPRVNLHLGMTPLHQLDVQRSYKDVARAVARDGIVLLKNEAEALPLKNTASLAIIGQDAVEPDTSWCPQQACNKGTLAMGWSSGAVFMPYLVSPLEAIQSRASTGKTRIVTSTTNNHSSAASAAAAAETAVVFINADSGEGSKTVEGVEGDRPNLDPWYDGNGLVAAAASAKKPVIVVIHSVGPLLLEEILSHENVVAIVWAGLPGQESGNALADVLYGSVSPSGKLPYTIAKKEADYGTSLVKALDDSFPEGLFIDYRHFDQAKIEPRFEFGFGLSYTKFEYSDMTISVQAKAGHNPGLYDRIATVRVKVKNVGQRKGAEVVQLYVSLPPGAPAGPPKLLRGFAKTDLEPGSDAVVEFELRRKDLSYWSTEKKSFSLVNGEATILVGASSRDIRLQQKLNVELK